MGLQARFQQDLLTAAELRVLFKNSIIGTLVLIFTYGIFIPNNWRRATLRDRAAWRWHRWSPRCSWA